MKHSRGKNVKRTKWQGIALPAKHNFVWKRTRRSVVGGGTGAITIAITIGKRNDIHIIMNSINKKINRHPIRPLSPLKSTISGASRDC